MKKIFLKKVHAITALSLCVILALGACICGCSSNRVKAISITFPNYADDFSVENVTVELKDRKSLEETINGFSAEIFGNHSSRVKSVDAHNLPYGVFKRAMIDAEAVRRHVAEYRYASKKLYRFHHIGRSQRGNEHTVLRSQLHDVEKRDKRFHPTGERPAVRGRVSFFHSLAKSPYRILVRVLQN